MAALDLRTIIWRRSKRRPRRQERTLWDVSHATSASAVGCQINRLIRRLLWVETLDAAPCDWSVAEEAAIRQEIAHRTILQPPPRLRQSHAVAAFRFEPAGLHATGDDLFGNDAVLNLGLGAPMASRARGS